MSMWQPGDNPLAEIDRLLASLDDPDPARRVAAIDALGQWDATHQTGDLSARAVQRVAAALGDPWRDVRWSAAYALGALGYAGGVPALLDLLAADDPAGDTGLRLVAIKALGKIGDGLAAPVLLALAASSESPCLRTAARRALDRISTSQQARGNP
jgi:HEAT repeat protein